jgi:hypothetical protein
MLTHALSAFSLVVKRDVLTPALSTQCWQGFADLQLDMLIDGMLR